MTDTAEQTFPVDKLVTEVVYGDVVLDAYVVNGEPAPATDEQVEQWRTAMRGAVERGELPEDEINFDAELTAFPTQAFPVKSSGVGIIAIIPTTQTLTITGTAVDSLVAATTADVLRIGATVAMAALRIGGDNVVTANVPTVDGGAYVFEVEITDGGELHVQWQVTGTDGEIIGDWQDITLQVASLTATIQGTAQALTGILREQAQDNSAPADSFFGTPDKPGSFLN